VLQQELERKNERRVATSLKLSGLVPRSVRSAAEPDNG
jgi:hypothetical protein